jgi:tetratricopeptide (TPR) repeat protein
MLETIGEYALEKLVESEDSGEAGLMQKRHADYYLALTLEAQPKLKGPEQALWLDRLSAEHQNLLAALEWSDSSDNASSLGLQLAVAIWRFWEIRGYLTEGRKWLLAMLSKPQAVPRTTLRAAALRAAGRLARLQGDYAAAYDLYEESLGISRELNDKPGLSSALFSLGFVAFDQGDNVTARARYEEALPLLRDMGDSYFTAGALYSLGNMAAQEEDYALATSRYEESLRMYREMGDLHGIANSLLGLGELARSMGDYEAAYKLNTQGLQIWEELGHRLNIALTMHNLGYVARRLGDQDKARSLFSEALKIYRDIEEKPGLAECLVGLAAVDAESNPEKTVRLLSAANQLMEASGYSLAVSERKEYDLALTTARAALEDAHFDNAVQSGLALSLEQVVSYALDGYTPVEGMLGSWAT